MSSAQLLLRGAFLEGREALDAWEAWLASTSLDAVDPECFALLPLVHRKLEALGADHAELGRLKGVRRRIWLENQLVLREAAETVQCLTDAGIDALLLGGLGLVAGYYRDAGLRPIRQIEILVPRRQASLADFVLALAPPRVVLRRQVLPLGCPRRIEEAFWAASEPVQVLDAAARVPAPAEQLLYTLVRGARWSGVPSSWWMADAIVILSESRVDAARVAELAAELRLTLFVRRALEQLGLVLGRPVAPDLLEALSDLPVSYADRLEYEYVRRPRPQRPLLSWLVAIPRRLRRIHS